MIKITGDGLSLSSFNRQLAGGLTIAGKKNKLIDDAYRSLEEMKTRNEAVVAVQMVAATYTTLGKEAQLRKNASTLARAIQGWGGCDTSEVIGNPIEGFFCTIPGFRAASVSPATCMDLNRALSHLPLTRPASPWADGSFLFRTPDGKPFPYSAFSSQQDAFLTLIVSPPGGGKSVLMNSLNLALTLDPMNTDFPMIRLLDIGPSASGFPRLLQSALPVSLQHKAQYIKIQNTAEFAFNPFDTPLGQRQPLPAHFAELVDLVTLLATPLNNETRGPVAQIASASIEFAYKRFSDDGSGQPRAYSPRTDFVIDEAINSHDVRIDEHTTWWEIVDAFVDRKEYRLAQLAQRYAMPVMAEIAQAATDAEIASNFRDISSGQIPLIDEFRRSITLAIKDYAIFGGPTRFDLGDTPIVIMDLNDVAPKGSPAADRQTAVFYMAALRLLSSDFFIGRSMLPLFDERYRDFHAQRIEKMERSKKRLCADELHRPAESAPAVMQSMARTVREGRKWQIEIMLASQSFNDFPSAFIENMTCLFVLKPPSTGAKQYAEAFSLNNTEIYQIENLLRGPSAEGANLFARFGTKSGDFSHLLTNTTGSRELWAFSTTKEDTTVRDYLYQLMPSDKARTVLAAAYPGGSCKSKSNAVKPFASSVETVSTRSVVDEIIDELKVSAKTMGYLH